MVCPFLEYRREAGDLRFDEARAYCTAAGRFVQPMRADICNDRYDLVHERDCEIYREHASEVGRDRTVEDATDAAVEADSDGETTAGTDATTDRTSATSRETDTSTDGEGGDAT